MRKFLSLFTAVAVALALLLPAASVVVARDPCSSYVNQTYGRGVGRGASEVAIRAVVFVNFEFRQCTGQPWTYPHGVFGYLQINDNDQFRGGQFLTFGIGTCSGVGNPEPCSDSLLHLYSQAAGCGYPAISYDLGEIAWQSTNDLRIVKSEATGHWQLINNQVILQDWHYNNNRLGCWEDSFGGEHWIAQRWDGGDSFGTAALGKTVWTNMQWRDSNYAWHPLNYSYCNYNPTGGSNPSHCSMTGNTMYTWSDR